MNKIGIDFGTSFCTASWINPLTGQPEPIRFIESGLVKMPSVVYYSPEGPVVGQIASEMIERLSSYPPEERMEIMMSLKQGIKRDMNKNMKEYLPDGRVLTHVQIISDILAKVKSQAEEGCFGGQQVESVILTHPVDFGQWQKDMLQEAAALAGFIEIELLEEPVAAAMGYASSGAKVGNGILVYDFGGGTFDAAFVQREGSSFHIPISPEGEAFCGGEDIDLAIYDHFEKQIISQYNRSISPDKRHLDLQFKAQCRKHKEILSRLKSHVFTDILPPPGDLVRFRSTTTRDEFETLIAPIVDKTIKKTQLLLDKVKAAGLTIDTVVLIGGTSRIPLVETRLAAILPVKALHRFSISETRQDKVIIPDSRSSQMLKCRHCDQELETDSKFCIYCGSSDLELITIQENTARICHNCGKELSNNPRFCIYCGAKQ